MHVSKFALALLTVASFQFPNYAMCQEYKYADVNGIRMTYVEAGAGDPVVLVHGGLQDLRFWKPHHLDVFAKRYRAIAYSRRNHFPAEVSPEGGQDAAAGLHGDDLAGY